MSNYQRLISYIYTYEGGIKGKNIGFVKMETRNSQCRITVNVKKIFVGGNPLGVFLLSNQGELQIGTLFARNGAGEFRAAVNSANIEDSGRSMEEFYGLSVHDVESAWRAYTTIWEDAVAHAAEVELADVTAENIQKKQVEATPVIIHSETELPISKEIEKDLELEEKLETEERAEAHRREYWKRDGVSVRESLLETPRHASGRSRDNKMLTMEMMTSEETETVAEGTELKNPLPAAPGPDTVPGAALLNQEVICPEDSRQEPRQDIRQEMMPPKVSEPQPAQPEIIQPRTPGADIVQPQTPEVEIILPETTEPEIPQPEPSGPEMMQPQTPGAELAQPMPYVPVSRDENEIKNHQEMWEFLRKKCAKILAFDYADGCEILTIKPQDIGLLPRDNWVLGNNSFLLHGYYNFRYLILARLENPGGMPRYILGIPGNYFSNEKYMAAMFGFPDFVLSKTQSSSEGRFGYWYADIKIGE